MRTLLVVVDLYVPRLHARLMSDMLAAIVSTVACLATFGLWAVFVRRMRR